MYRLNTYPVIHAGFFHALLNTIALTPLLERFEAEHGTLTALALFVGRMLFAYSGLRGTRLTVHPALSTFPGGVYILIEKYILHMNTAVVGARSVFPDFLPSFSSRFFLFFFFQTRLEANKNTSIVSGYSCSWAPKQSGPSAPIPISSLAH